MRPRCEIAYMCPSDFPCKDCDRGHSKLGKVIVCNEPRKEEKIAALVAALKELGVDVPQWLPLPQPPKEG